MQDRSFGLVDYVSKLRELNTAFSGWPLWQIEVEKLAKARVPGGEAFHRSHSTSEYFRHAEHTVLVLRLQS